MTVQRISSRQNERVKAVVALREAAERRRTGLFIAEGMREVQRAAEAGLGIREIFVCPELIRQSIPVIQKALPGFRQAQWFEVPESVMIKLAYREHPEGILAVCEQPTWTLDTIKARVRPELWLVASGLSKPGNLGAMARTAAAAGVAALIVTGGRIDAFNPNVIRASTGAIFTLPVVEAEVTQALSFFSKRDVKVFAADPCATNSYSRLDLRGPSAIVIGAEDLGVDSAWTQHSAVTPAAIPTAGGLVDSLNASVAAAIFLFEARRQQQAIAEKKY